MAVISAWISVFFSILSMRARSTLRILPRMGRIAWVPRVARAIRGAAGGVALDDEQLALARIAAGAVGQLVGHARARQAGLAPDDLAGLPGGHPRLGRRLALLHDLVGLGGVLLEPLGQLLVGGPLDQRAHRDVAELGLGLALELRLAQLHGDDGGEALADVLAEEVVVLLLQQGSCPTRAYLLTTLVRAFLKPSSCMPPSMVAMPLAKEWMPSW